jgi:hypothetical protein
MAPPEGLFLQNQNDSMGDWCSLSARTGYYPVVGVRFDNKKQLFAIPCAINATSLSEKNRIYAVGGSLSEI